MDTIVLTNRHTGQLAHNVGDGSASDSFSSRKQLLIAASLLIGLAVFVVMAFSFGGHAKGVGGSASNNNASQSAKPPVQESTGSTDTKQAGTTQTNNSSVNIKLNSTSTSSSAGSSSSSDLTVNGQHVSTDGGNVDEHYTSSDGSTNVNISVHNNSSIGGSGQ